MLSPSISVRQSESSPTLEMSSPDDRDTKKRKLSDDDVEASIFDKPRKKPIACKPCHTRKIKCSFGHPCAHCVQAKNTEACVYPARDSKVTVSSSYIEKLIAENRQLKEHRLSQHENYETGHEVTDEPAKAPDLVLEASEARNPLLDDRSWFFPLANSGPIHISEAADAAFATRLRQTLAPDGVAEHIPRVDYVTDAKLISLAEAEAPWPTLARAKLLVKTAFDTVGSCYYCVRKSDVYNRLKQHYRNPSGPGPRTIFMCKLEALFALGEAYSCRTQSTSEDTFPGLAYFARASRTLRGIRERPQLDWIEVLLLLVCDFLVTTSTSTDKLYSPYTLCYSIEGTAHTTWQALLFGQALFWVYTRAYQSPNCRIAQSESTEYASGGHVTL